MNEFWKLRQKMYRGLEEIGSVAGEKIQEKVDEAKTEVLKDVKARIEETEREMAPKEPKRKPPQGSDQKPPKKDQSTLWAVIMFGVCMLALIGLSFAPEGDHIGEVETPGSPDTFIGENYKNVQTMFEEAGFKNIQTEAVDDLVLGILTEEYEVEDVSVNGDTEFSSGEWVDRNAKVLIRYHVYPESEEEGITEDEEESGPDSSGEAEDKRLTVENSPELASMLTNKADLDPSYKAFSEEHFLEVIEFDGRVDYLGLHGDYKTRYDMLVSAGDFDPNTMRGPAFKFEDVNAQNMGMKDDEVINTGKNVHIVARVLEYNEKNGLFFLDPIEVTLR